MALGRRHKLVNARAIHTGMGQLQPRWAQQLAEKQERVAGILGDALLAAAFVTESVCAHSDSSVGCTSVLKRV